MVRGVNHENNAIDRAAVFAPCFSRLKVTAQVVRVEPDISNSNFCLVRVHCAVSLCESIALKHVEQRGFASVVKADENDIGRLLEES